jgi:hypothetical protein
MLTLIWGQISWVEGAVPKCLVDTVETE